MVARQFVEIARLRLEGLLAAFPKLLGGESRQHTYIDTESVRYVYQPIDNFFLLLITNKTSNIVQDLHTLQLLAKAVPDTCGYLTEESIRIKQFDLVFAFDEILTAGGHVEKITLAQIRTNLEMESHEEKLHNMILQSKRAAAKTEMKRQQQRIKVEQRDRQRMERATGITMPSSAGFGSSTSNSTPTYNTPPPAAPVIKEPVVKSMGMKLGGAKKGKSFIDAMTAEDDLQQVPIVPSVISEPVVAPVFTQPIVVEMEEKINVTLTRDGDIEGIEVKGSLFVSSNDPELGPSQLKLVYSADNGVNFMCHPKMHKKLFEETSILRLKDKTKGFPASRVGVLRWSYKSQEESDLPLNITCWPEDDGNGRFTVTLEYTMEKNDMPLHQVRICIPLGTGQHELPQILSIDGEYRTVDGILYWFHDCIDKETNGTGNLEFSIRADNMDVFFPVTIEFAAKQTFAHLRIDTVEQIESKESVEFALTQSLMTDSYIVS